MSIILPEDYHARKALEDRKIHCITRAASECQDIRPLRIGILNIMPKAEAYEYNILFPLGRSIIQIEPVWLKLHTHSYSSSNQSHLAKLYINFDDAIKYRGFDGIIVTGAPVEEYEFEDVTYWNELTEILKYANEHFAGILGICWGGLALSKFLGIDKINYNRKLFGVYPIRNLERGNRITGEMDDVFYCPQSRNAGIPDEALEKAAGEGIINLLGYSEKAGYTIFESSDSKFMMHLGHPEYPTNRLWEEYDRDIAAGVEGMVPPENISRENMVNNWRAHGLEFFTQWVKKIYLDTPFDI